MSVAGDEPTGTVTVTSGDRVVGEAEVVDGAATASLDSVDLGVGRHTLSLSYSGDDSNAASVGTADLVVTRARVTVRAAVKPKSPKAGTRPRVQVAAVARGVTPEGRVFVRRGGKKIAAGRLNRRGAAVLRLPAQRRGAKRIVVVYSATDDFTGARKVVRFRVRR